MIQDYVCNTGFLFLKDDPPPQIIPHTPTAQTKRPNNLKFCMVGPHNHTLRPLEAILENSPLGRARGLGWAVRRGEKS